MNKFFILFTCCLPFTLMAQTEQSMDANGFVTQEHALMCIKTNKTMNTISQELLSTENRKSLLKSKIHYLHNRIQKRRQLIEQLDQQHDQSNNKDYNQLITQFENLLNERKQSITFYDEENQLYVTQNKQLTHLEQQFSAQCLQHLKISNITYQNVCQSEKAGWCALLKL